MNDVFDEQSFALHLISTSSHAIHISDLTSDSSRSSRSNMVAYVDCSNPDSLRAASSSSYRRLIRSGLLQSDRGTYVSTGKSHP